MTQWEYRLVSLTKRNRQLGADIVDAIESVTSKLNELGQRGWEAVGEVRVFAYGQVSYNDLTSTQLLMKREIRPHDDHDC